MAQEATVASPGPHAVSSSHVEEESTTREAADVAGGGLLGAGSSAQPLNPLVDEEEDLFSGSDFLSSSVPAFTSLVGVEMLLKTSTS